MFFGGFGGASMSGGEQQEPKAIILFLALMRPCQGKFQQGQAIFLRFNYQQRQAV